MAAPIPNKDPPKDLYYPLIYKPPLHPGKPSGLPDNKENFPTISPTDKIRVISKEIAKPNPGAKK